MWLLLLGTFYFKLYIYIKSDVPLFKGIQNISYEGQRQSGKDICGTEASSLAQGSHEALLQG